MGSSGDLISPNALTCSSSRTTLYFQHNDKDCDAGTVAGSDQRRMSSFHLMDVIPNAEVEFSFLDSGRYEALSIKGVCALKHFRMAPCSGQTNGAL